MREAAIEVHHVDVAERGEQQTPSVRRLRGPLDQASANGAGLFLQRQSQVRSNSESDVCGKGNDLRRRCGDIDSPDLSTIADEQGFTIGHERITRQEIARGAGFLLVMLNGIKKCVIRAHAEVPKAKFRLSIQPRPIKQEATVRRNNGSYRAALGRYDRLHISGGQVATNNMPERKTDLVGEAQTRLLLHNKDSDHRGTRLRPGR